MSSGPIVSKLSAHDTVAQRYAKLEAQMKRLLTEFRGEHIALTHDQIDKHVTKANAELTAARKLLTELYATGAASIIDKVVATVGPVASTDRKHTAAVSKEASQFVKTLHILMDTTVKAFVRLHGLQRLQIEGIVHVNAIVDLPDNPIAKKDLAWLRYGVKLSYDIELTLSVPKDERTSKKTSGAKEKDRQTSCRSPRGSATSSHTRVDAIPQHYTPSMSKATTSSPSPVTSGSTALSQGTTAVDNRQHVDTDISNDTGGRAVNTREAIAAARLRHFASIGAEPATVDTPRVDKNSSPILCVDLSEELSSGDAPVNGKCAHGQRGEGAAKSAKKRRMD